MKCDAPYDAVMHAIKEHFCFQVVERHRHPMNDRIYTRLATIADAAELARLNFLFNRFDDIPEVIATRMSDPRRMETPIVAEIDGCVVGFCAVHIVPSIFYPTPRAEVTEMYVEESFRRRGVGRALMAHAEQFALENGAADLLVLTDFYNHEAQGLYRAMGFKNNDIVMIKIFNTKHERD
ncbi:MAG: GNAT family N-acetyltransferase [Anaerolineae bacterium]